MKAALPLLLVGCVRTLPATDGADGAPGPDLVELGVIDWPDLGDRPGGGMPEEDPVAAVDVLVIGGGPAGLAAALEAQDAGASVLLLERDLDLGGALRWASSYLTFPGTEEQLAEGVDDSPELLLSEWSAITGGDPGDPWVIAYAERVVPDVRDWLAELGVVFRLSDQMDPGATVRRIHASRPNGAGLVRELADGLDSAGVWTQTEAKDLVFDDRGRCWGAWVGAPGAEPADGWVRADAVVAATGGFLRNLDLVVDADDDLDPDGLWMSTGVDADGNGHLLLEQAGAAWQNGGAIGIYAHGVADPRTEGEELVIGGIESTVWFNTGGHRFVDERATNEFQTGRAVVDQPGQLAFAVFDADARPEVHLADPMVTDGEDAVEVPELDELEASGQLVVADDLAELAELVGIDRAAFVAEVEAHNDAVMAGETDPFTDGEATVTLIEEPPFYAIRVVPVLAKAFGGIDVDTQGRVARFDGSTIDGLYAAGELTGMAGGSLVGDVGWTGSASAVLLSGRIAGATAATEALDR